MSIDETVVRPQVALFIDLENIRYSFLSQFKYEPDFKSLFGVARAEGPVSVAYAYADFSRHPEAVRRQLEALGITCRDTPVRVQQSNGETRVKSTVDPQMMLDILETALDRPQVKTFIVGTGDSDFLRIVTMLQNRFEKRVLVIGVPGTLSQDLAAAATDVINLEPVVITGDNPIVGAIVHLMRTKTPPVGFWTLPQLAKWANQTHNGVPGTDSERSAAISFMVQNGLIRQEVLPAEGELTERRASSIDEENELVKEILAGSTPKQTPGQSLLEAFREADLSGESNANN